MLVPVIVLGALAGQHSSMSLDTRVQRPAHAGALLFQATASENRRFNKIVSSCDEMRIQPVGGEGEHLFSCPSGSWWMKWYSPGHNLRVTSFDTPAARRFDPRAAL